MFCAEGRTVNKLYFGDNLDVLRERIKDESVDLVYLDPPFNSSATYNVLFKESFGVPSEAQAEAFRDTWGWGESAAIAYDEVQRSQGDAAALLRALRSWLGENAMMAYLAMMTVRLQELKRVLKLNGSIYLHCDSTASHYLRLMMDCIFGQQNFRSEIVWKRATAHSDATSARTT
jgi:adenine specific DNA methylase Mod